jgi:peptidoglycan/LPS O-acetylase OafA/YrhL
MSCNSSQEMPVEIEVLKSSYGNQESKVKKNRIAYLDGLRAIAILTVIMFHYYYNFPKNVNVLYGKDIGELIFIKYGKLGVMLFFSISGFVITQTLHSSASPKHFISKRFSRLFPAMLLCSMLTYTVSFILPTTYTSNAYSFLPSLTFIEPKVFNLIFRTEKFEWMDGAYWSLFTEVRFYTISALIYFISKHNFYRNFLYFALITGFIFPLVIFLKLNQLRIALSFFLIADQLPWFVFGIGCYCLHNNQNKKAMSYSLVSLFSMVFYAIAVYYNPCFPFDSLATIVGMLGIFLLVYLVIKINIIRNVLSLPPLTQIGVASYSLYLLHQNIGQKLIYIIDINVRKTPELLSLAYLIPIFILIISADSTPKCNLFL